MNNTLRAEAAFVALKAFNEHMPNGELDEVVADLLCNLMHLLDNPDLGFFHLSFSHELKEAYRYYEEEIKS
jgi:hypothetical protein|tara:strand:+ start:106 stop:318 length:213 start_codon:yes stop_codon:yes gene_type:complete